MALIPADQFLATDIILLILAILSFIGNGFILTVFYTHGKLRKNQNLYLIMALATNDVAIATFEFPYIIFLIANWGPVINYPPIPVVCLSLPLMATQRITNILILSIAIDRFYAMQWPAHYRGKSKLGYLIIALTVAIFSGLLEAFLYWVTTDIQRVPGCAAGSCFFGTGYRIIGGTQGVIINGSTCILTLVLVIKLRMLNAKKTIDSVGSWTTAPTRSPQEQEFFRSANQTAMTILVICSIFKFLPGIFITFGGFMGITVFKSLGPVSAFAVLVCGITNSITYGSKHHAIREAIVVLRSRLGGSNVPH